MKTAYKFLEPMVLHLMLTVFIALFLTNAFGPGVADSEIFKNIYSVTGGLVLIRSFQLNVM